eukprot:Rmarinus@m.25851
MTMRPEIACLSKPGLIPQAFIGPYNPDEEREAIAAYVKNEEKVLGRVYKARAHGVTVGVKREPVLPEVDEKAVSELKSRRYDDIIKECSFRGNTYEHVPHLFAPCVKFFGTLSSPPLLMFGVKVRIPDTIVMMDEGSDTLHLSTSPKTGFLRQRIIKPQVLANLLLTDFADEESEYPSCILKLAVSNENCNDVVVMNFTELQKNSWIRES